jgi:GTPase SAR1 family protein
MLTLRGIVAVHGLFRGFKSWTLGGEKNTWLATPFAQELDKAGINARIMTFSYNPEALSLQFLVRKVLYGSALDLVQELKVKRKNATRRPLVLIAHSLGGLIVKRALIISYESSDMSLRDIELSTAGIFFYGTPDTNVAAEKLETIIRKIARLSYKPRTLKKEDKDSVHRDTQWLKKELEAFKPIASAIEIVPFAENVHTQFGSGSFHSSLVVDRKESQKSSSPSQDPPIPTVGLEKRHTGLIKFDDTHDPGYRCLVERLRKIVSPQHRTTVDHKWEAYDDKVALLDAGRLVFPVNRDFKVEATTPSGVEMAMRLHLKDKVEKELSKAAQIEHFAILTVCGRAGVGKTTLVRSFSHDEERRGKTVFWLNAESHQSINRGYLELAQHICSYYLVKYPNNMEDRGKRSALLRAELGLPDVEKLLQAKDFSSIELVKRKAVVKAVKNWLLRDGNEWLLVYENVGVSFDLQEFIPLSTKGRIILITREEKNLCPWSTSEITVPVWTTDDAVELLLKQSRFSELKDESNNESNCKSGTSVASGCRYANVIFQVRVAREIVVALSEDSLSHRPLTISCAARKIASRGFSTDLSSYGQSLLNDPSLSIKDVSNRVTIEKGVDSSPTLAAERSFEILEVSTMLAHHAIPFDLFLWETVHENRKSTEAEERLGKSSSAHPNFTA